MNSFFGQSLALAGSVLFVGGGQNGEEAYVFGYDAGSDAWSQTAALTAPAADSSPFGFGISLAASSDGSILAVGAPYKVVGGSSSAGGVYIYEKGSGWSSGSTNEAALLTASAPVAGEALGDAVAISADGSLVAGGADLSNASGQTSSGRVLPFQENGAWKDATQASSFYPSGIASSAQFGHALALSGSTLFIGGDNTNAVYVLAYNSGTGQLSQLAVLAQPSAYNTDSAFGCALAISSDGLSLLVGADCAAYPGAADISGGVSVYRKGSGWTSGASNLTGCYRIPGYTFSDWEGLSVAWVGSQAASGIPLIGTGSISHEGGVALYTP